jgi:heat shock protein HslJ
MWIGVLLLASVLLAACGTVGAAGNLLDTEWELEELNGRDALDDVSVTMRLSDDDELSGSGGCNRYFGTWDTGDGDEITLNASGSTMMACEQPVMDQEQAFFEALAATTTYRLDDDELELFNADGREVAEFELLEPATLTGTEWQVTAFNNGQQAIVSALDGTTLTASFDTEDNLSGNAGCNTYNAGFSRDDGEITIEQAATTLMACDPPVMEQETQFLQALTQAKTYELGHETLYLRAADGALLVSFREVD